MTAPVRHEITLRHPLDVLLYQRWPLRRERPWHARLRDMQLEFEFAD